VDGDHRYSDMQLIISNSLHAAHFGADNESWQKAIADLILKWVTPSASVHANCTGANRLKHPSYLSGQNKAGIMPPALFFEWS
jgi:hypothetical protein